MRGYSYGYAHEGFYWTSVTYNGSEADCTAAGPVGENDFGAAGAISINSGLDSDYGHVDCYNPNGIARQDGEDFSVQSVDIAAQDFAKIITDENAHAEISDSLRILESAYPFIAAENLEDEITDAGFDPTSPEGEAYGIELAERLERDYQAYRDLIRDASDIYPNKFYVAGLLDGEEVARLDFGQTDGRITLELEGFDKIDQLTFGAEPNGFEASMFNHYASDFGYTEFASPNSVFCFYACDAMDLFSFDYDVASVVTDPADPSDPDPLPSPVPLPAGLTLLLGALALLGSLGARNRRS